MKPRKKAILTAAAVTALFGAGGCGNNEVQNVYGPPPDDYNYRVESSDVQTAESTESQDTADEFNPADNKNVDVYGPPPAIEETQEGFEPEMNIIPAVYGPPEWTDDLSETPEAYATEEVGDVFVPSDNMNEDVYGPPGWFGGTSESEEIVETDETEDTDESQFEPDIGIYRPETNITPCVYGPPEWFATREAGPVDSQEE